MNFIRNRVIHYNGYYDEKAKETFNKYFNKILKVYRNVDYMKLSIGLFIDVFEKYINQLEKFDYLIIDDTMENIIRNINIFIMESLYICKKSEYLFNNNND